MSSSKCNLTIDISDIIYVLSLSRLLKGRSIPGKILLSRRVDPPDNSNSKISSPNYKRSFSHNDAGTSDNTSGAVEVISVLFITISFHSICLYKTDMNGGDQFIKWDFYS